MSHTTTFFFGFLAGAACMGIFVQMMLSSIKRDIKRIIKSQSLERDLQIEKLCPKGIKNCVCISDIERYPIPLVEAQRLNVCRICGERGAIRPSNPLVLNYGREYAHQKCLDSLKP